MKKLFISAIPICLVSYILFGISVAIMSTKRYTGNAANSGTYEDYGTTNYIDDIITGTGQWTLTEVTPNVILQTSGINAYVIQSADEFIHIFARTSGGKVAVKAEGEHETLRLEIHPPEITFEDIINFGQILWNEDIFHGSPSAEVVVAFPKLIYESLEVQHGSGTIMIDGFNAEHNDFDIGSGRFEFSKSDQYIANFFNVDLGSGNAVISNMQTRGYRIDIGSGKFDFSGLSGTGDISMGSGSGNIAYADSPEYGGELDMGSGNLSMFLPDEYGCSLNMDIGSGSIAVDAFGKKETYKDDDYIELGNADGSGSCFDIDMGSGKVNIRNTSAYTAPTMFEGRPDNVEELGAVRGIVIDGNGAIMSTEYKDTSVIEGVTISSGTSWDFSTVASDSSGVASSGSSSSSVPAPPKDPSAPSAPEAPDAPPAPEAPSASSSSSVEQTAAA